MTTLGPQVAKSVSGEDAFWGRNSGGFTRIQFEKKKKQTKFVGHYIMGELLGEGSYGKVKEGMDINTFKRVAVKIFSRRNMRKIRGMEERIQSEIVIMKKLHHPCVIELFEVIVNEEKDKLYIILEYVGGGSLQDLLDRTPGKKLDEAHAQWFFQEIVKGLQYIHSQGVVHRDIKPGNIMLCPNTGKVKISDFGVSEIPEKYAEEFRIHKATGSPAFQPPEIAKGVEVAFNGYKTDVWALGVTLYLMVCGKVPFGGESIGELFDNIGKGEFSIPDEVSKGCRDMLKGLMDVNQAERFTLDQVMQHSWFTEESGVTADDIQALLPPEQKCSLLTKLQHHQAAKAANRGGADSCASSPPLSPRSMSSVGSIESTPKCATCCAGPRCLVM